MEKVVDRHVMAETLAKETEYTGERNWSLNTSQR